MKAYVVNQNATQAAIEAGYSKKTAHVTGSRMLRNVKVREMIDLALERVAENQQVRAEEVIRETRNLAFSNMLDYLYIDDMGVPHFDFSRINRDTGSAIKKFHMKTTTRKDGNGDTIEEIMFGIDLHDKHKALDMLGTATGVYRKHTRFVNEGSQKVNINVITKNPDD